ncbi:hypothetical protein CBS1_05395 [Fervidobacterium changbaicum]|uniref:Uncharacterized protein n=1 Tax=Fervidobacterium changbaicum TaxID=310769 RepID=A0ABX5QS43_9BACT|nr:hypothetical protein CBS1_05395 [Fervidobacterium changbaicum]
MPRIPICSKKPLYIAEAFLFFVGFCQKENQLLMLYQKVFLVNSKMLRMYEQCPIKVRSGIITIEG